MRRSSRLVTLFNAAKKDLERLRHVGVELESTTERASARRLATYLTVNSVNLWSNFVRAYYLSIVMGSRAVGGGKVSAGIPDTDVN